MHRFRSIQTIRRLRLAVLLLLFFRYVLIPAFFILLVSALLRNRPEQATVALAMLPIIGVVAFLLYLLNNRTLCPLCTTPVLGSKSCNKHKNAKPLYGSYKLRVALSILLTNQFRCPYCNEPSALEVRKKGQRSAPHR